MLDLSQVLVLELMSPVIRFALGSFAGACGATAVYPIDLGIIDKNILLNHLKMILINFVGK